MVIQFDTVTGTVDSPIRQEADPAAEATTTPHPLPVDEQFRQTLRLLAERACRLHAD
jgi:hypothetical protein